MNSQTVITEQGFDVRVQYYQWISAWSGGAGACFSWKPVFLCLWLLIRFRTGGRKESASRNCRRFGQFLNTSSSQSEAIAWISPRVNQADVPLDSSVTAILLWLAFLLSTNCKIFETILVRHADLAAAYYFPRRLSFSASLWQGSCASLLHFSSEVQRTAASFCPWGFPDKTQAGRFKWPAQMAPSKWNTSSGAELL